MQSQYGSLYHAAAAQNYMEVGRRLVKLDGLSISWGESIVRNLLCIVEHFPYSISYLLGVLLACTSPTKQRLGYSVVHAVAVHRF